MQIQNRTNWFTQIKKYLKTRKEPDNREERRKLRNQVARYTLIEGELCKRSFTISYLKCLIEEDAKYALREIYKGVCGNHLGQKNYYS